MNSALQELHERFDGTELHFLMVYIAEAHAANEWPMGVQIDVTQPTTLEERQAAARKFLGDFPDFSWPVCIDKPGDDAFDKLYSCWPTRFYIFDGRSGVPTVVFKAEPRANGKYDLDDVLQWIEEHPVADGV